MMQIVNKVNKLILFDGLISASHYLHDGVEFPFAYNVIHQQLGHRIGKREDPGYNSAHCHPWSECSRMSN